MTKEKQPTQQQPSTPAVFFTDAATDGGDFLSLQKKEFQEVYALFCENALAHKSPLENEISITEFIREKYNFPEKEAKTLSHKLVSKFSSSSFSYQFYDRTVEIRSGNCDAVPAEPQKVYITSQDYKNFVELTSADHTITPALRALLLSFIIFYRLHFHPRGWVHYNKKNIFYLAGASQLPVKTQEKMTKYLHDNYGLNMQVIGSNQPITCFKFDWLFEQPIPGSDDNPWIKLGPLTLETVQQIVSKLK